MLRPVGLPSFNFCYIFTQISTEFMENCKFLRLSPEIFTSDLSQIVKPKNDNVLLGA